MLDIKDITNTIIQGDCLEVMKQMPDNCVDLVLTDPPYGINLNGKIRDKASYDSFDDTPEYISSLVIPVIHECLRVSRTVVLTPGWNNLHMYPKPRGFGCFYSPASTGLQSWGNMDAQPILYYGKPYIKQFGKKCSWQLTERPSCKAHPCSKPQKAWEIILKKCSNENNMVLDPFLGSGTTAVACEKFGRNYIGIEISKEYCEIARKRVQEAKDSMGLFNNKTSK